MFGYQNRWENRGLKRSFQSEGIISHQNGGNGMASIKHANGYFLEQEALKGPWELPSLKCVLVSPFLNISLSETSVMSKFCSDLEALAF